MRPTIGPRVHAQADALEHGAWNAGEVISASAIIQYTAIRLCRINRLDRKALDLTILGEPSRFVDYSILWVARQITRPRMTSSLSPWWPSCNMSLAATDRPCSGRLVGWAAGSRGKSAVRIRITVLSSREHETRSWYRMPHLLTGLSLCGIIRQPRPVSEMKR
jgi:hypothetical protein